MRRHPLACLLCSFICVPMFAKSVCSHHAAGAVVVAHTNPQAKGFVYIPDMGFSVPASCRIQQPGLYLYSPASLLAPLPAGVNWQDLQSEPKPENSLPVLTIVSQGCVNRTAAGPVCQSVTGVSLLSDRSGSVAVQASAQHSVAQSWQTWHNGFGASTSCSALVSQFLMSDVDRLRNSKGEFLVATYSGTGPLKVYTVKQRHLKRLGLQ
jgi:hypothetical protein